MIDVLNLCKTYKLGNVEVSALVDVTFSFDRGRYFNADEIRTSRQVAVLGATVVKNLFENVEPIGKTMKVDGKNYLVIGIMEAKGALSWFDPDDQIFIPVSTAQKRLFGMDYVQFIDVQAANIYDLEAIMEGIDRLLRLRHNLREGEESDFHVQNSSQWLSSWGDAAKTFTYLLGGIAAISLMVGGIGILLGLLISKFVSKLGGWETVVSPESILLSFGFSVGIGIFFGYYPANKAANLNPIEALRYE